MTKQTEQAKFSLERQGIILEPDMNRPFEVGGVLNPATAQHNGTAYLLYRAVAAEPHNYSRIMLAELHSESDSPKMKARRLDLCALEPQEPYEKWRDGVHGGVEDPRVTPLDGSYLMAYTAYGDGPGGDALPRIALARSPDLLHWERMGLIKYTPLHLKGRSNRLYTIDLQTVSNKDAMLFPEKIGGRYVLMHRPTFPPAIARDHDVPASIWLSYSHDLLTWTDHTLLLSPAQPWERLKTGGGTPPLRTARGWLIFYHAVDGESDYDPNRRYLAGAALLDLEDPRKVLYRSAWPVLQPGTQQEQVGVVNNVVFPTGILPLTDGRVQVIYGMADQAIGLALTSAPVL